MAAYRQVYDLRHLQADCQEPGSAPEPYAMSGGRGAKCPVVAWRVDRSAGLVTRDKVESTPGIRRRPTDEVPETRRASSASD